MTIDNLLSELQENNNRIRAPLEKFWKISRELFTKSPEECFRRVEVETPFLDFWDVDAVSSLYPKTLDPNLIGNLNYKEILPYLRELGIKYDYAERLFEIQCQNSQILLKILSQELSLRFPNGYEGDYPFSGVDISTISQLGGEWRLLEPIYKEKDFEYLLNKNPQDSEKISQGIINVHRSYPSPGICDVLLIKCPTPGREDSDVVNDYEGKVKSLIISTNPNLNLPKEKSITGKYDTGLQSEFAISLGGGLSYPLSGFYLYLPK